MKFRQKPVRCPWISRYFPNDGNEAEMLDYNSQLLILFLDIYDIDRGNSDVRFCKVSGPANTLDSVL